MFSKRDDDGRTSFSTLCENITHCRMKKKTEQQDSQLREGITLLENQA